MFPCICLTSGKLQICLIAHLVFLLLNLLLRRSHVSGFFRRGNSLLYAKNARNATPQERIINHTSIIFLHGYLPLSLLFPASRGTDQPTALMHHTQDFSSRPTGCLSARFCSSADALPSARRSKTSKVPLPSSQPHSRPAFQFHGPAHGSVSAFFLKCCP